MNSEKVRVLVTDGNQRPALAIARSLAKRGFEVITADEKRGSLCASSRCAKESFLYPSPVSAKDEFIRGLRQECKSRHVDILLPVTEITTFLVLKERETFGDTCRIPFPDFNAFRFVSNKMELLALANELKIPVPQSFYIHNSKEIDKHRNTLKFPIVLKPQKSRILSEDGWIKTGVRYANNFLELEDICRQDRIFRDFPFMLQEYIQGPGYGIFTLYDQGTPIVYFAHRRVREKPPSGGVSVLCESVDVDPQLKEYSERIFSRVRWHGVAMVEFKRCQRTGISYLMEVNGRFWGSLQLAINAGIDFPYLLCQVALREKVAFPKTYRVGIRSRWLLGDLDHLYLTLTSRNIGPLKNGFLHKVETLLDFLTFFAPRTKIEIWSLWDPKPFLGELAGYLRNNRSRS